MSSLVLTTAQKQAIRQAPSPKTACHEWHSVKRIRRGIKRRTPTRKVARAILPVKRAPLTGRIARATARLVATDLA